MAPSESTPIQFPATVTDALTLLIQGHTVAVAPGTDTPLLRALTCHLALLKALREIEELATVIWMSLDHQPDGDWPAEQATAISDNVNRIVRTAEDALDVADTLSQERPPQKKQRKNLIPLLKTF